MHAVSAGGNVDKESSSIGSARDCGRDWSPGRESEGEAWSDGGGVWMGGDMIWGKRGGEGEGCAGQGEVRKLDM